MVKSIISVFITCIILLQGGCAPPREARNIEPGTSVYGAVLFQVVWPQTKSGSARQFLPKTPVGVVLMSITVGDFETVDFACVPGQDGEAEILNLPVGTYTATLEAKNYDGDVVYRSVVPEVTVVANQVLPHPDPVMMIKEDTTAPQVSQVSPLPDSTDFISSAAISCSFSEAMDPNSLSVASFSLTRTDTPLNELDFSLSFDSTFNTSTLIPLQLLELNTSYTCTVKASVMDAVENSLAAPYSWEFTTSAGSDDTTAPMSANLFPSANATEVGLDSNVSFELSDLESGLQTSSLNVTIEGTSVISNGVLQDGFGGSLIPDGNGSLLITVNPEQNFSYNQLVNVLASASDQAGNNMNELSYSFTCLADNESVTVNNQVPQPDSVGVAVSSSIVFSLNDNVSGVDQETLNVTILGEAAILNGVLQSQYGGSINGNSFNGFDITITPNLPFTYNQVVEITLNATDLGGNSMSELVYSFTCLSDNEAPSISSVLPPAEAVEIPLDSSINFKVSDDLAGVDWSSLNVKVEGANAISNGLLQAGYAGNLIQNANNGYDVSINPLSSFANNQVVNIIINCSDQAGNNMNALAYSFTCVSIADSSAPILGDFNPVADAVNIAQDTNIFFSITDSGGTGVDLTSLNVTVAGTNTIMDGDWADGFAGTMIPYNDGFLVTIDPKTHFAIAQNVTVVVNAQDQAGNAMTESSSSFTVSAEGWVDGGVMTDERYLHQATKLNDGQVLVTAGNISNICEIYDPLSASWDSTAQLNQGRELFTATLLADGTVLVAGGTYILSSLASAEIYDPLNQTWTTTTPLNQAREGHTATLLPDGTALVAGGLTNSGGVSIQNSCELYQPDSGTWATTGALNLARHRHTATLLNDGTVLVCGGEGTTPLTTCELYDPATKTWSTTAPLPLDRTYHTATLLNNGKVLIAGGNDGNSNILDDCLLYDPEKRAWEQAASLSQAREEQRAVLLLNGRVLVTGGYFTDEALLSTELYDPLSNSWSPGIELDLGRSGYSLTLLDSGQVLLSGGDYFFEGNYLYSTQSLLYSYSIPNDTTAPEISEMNPAPSAISVPKNTDIAFAIRDVLESGGSFSGIDLTTLTVSINGNPALLSGEFQEGYSGLITKDELQGYYVTINPTSDFSPSQSVTVSIDAEDIPGNIMNQTSYSFTCVSSHMILTDSMNHAREAHTSTMLNNGQVLVAGGYNGNNLTICELYDTSNNTWSETGALSQNRYDHEATLLNDGRVLVTGGYGFSIVALDVCEAYDASNGTWSSVESLSLGRYNHSATLLNNGKVLVAGGFHDIQGYLNDCYLFDPDTNSWSDAASLNYSRGAHKAILLNSGLVLVSGGSNLSSSELYNPGTDTWTTVGSLVQERSDHTMTMLDNGNILITGGWTYPFTALTSCEVNNPTLNTWSEVGDLLLPRFFHQADLLLDGRILITGGGTGSTTYADCEIFDVESSSSATDSLISAREEHATTVLGDGQVLISGGHNSSGTLNSCEIYTP